MSRLNPVPFRGFAGGLNLRDQPDVVDETQAIDLMNVTFTERGSVKTRSGYGQFTTAEGTNRYDSIAAYYKTDGTKQLVVGASIRLEAINTSGDVVTSTSTAASPHFFTRFGGPLGEYMFIANGTDTVRRYDGATFTTPTYTSVTPSGRFLSVTAKDNRLICARFTGTTGGSNPSSVRFSNPGDPLTFETNDYVDLLPGDGEEIMGVCTYGDYTFVFKQTKFFVFYAVEVTSAGTPVFHYRTIDAKVGLASPRALAVAPDGVYFMDARGVYRTQGGAPKLVSDAIDAFFTGDLPDFYTGGVLNHGAIEQCAMAWHDQQIYLAVPVDESTTNNRVLVLDPRYGWWTLWDIPATALGDFKVGDQADLLFAYATGGKHLGRHTGAYSTDAGSLISSLWRSGWYDLGTPNQKTIRELKIWGKGDFLFGLSVDNNNASVFNQVSYNRGDLWSDGTDETDLWADGTDLSDLWGATTAAQPSLIRRAVRGTTFSVSFTGSGEWAVHRLTSHIRGQRPPSVVSGDD